MEYDHDFLNGKFIETNKGVTYDLIDPLLMQRLSLLGNNDNNTNNDNNPNNDNNTNNDNKGVVNEKKSDDINEERVINSLIINDVLLNQEWNSLENPFWVSMSFYSLVSAITEKNEEEKSKQEERYKESNDEQEEVKKQIAEIKEIKAQEKVERKALEGEGEEKKEGEDGIEGEEKKKDDKKLIKIKEKMVMIILMMKLI